MLVFLDWFFLIFHMAVVFINLFGWIWSKTRKLNLITLSVTAISWFGLGLIYGIGYCPLTEWHWQVKERLGVQNLPISYVKYYVDIVFGVDSDPKTVDTSVFICFFIAIICAVIIDLKKKKGSQSSP